MRIIMIGMALVLSLHGLAQEDPRPNRYWYAGLRFGDSEIDGLLKTDNCSGNCFLVDNRDDEESLGILAGYRIHSYLRAELSYQELGEARLGDAIIGFAGTSFRVMEVKPETLGLSLAGVLPLGKWFEASAKLGLHHYDLDYPLIFSTEFKASGPTATNSSSGQDLFYGLALGVWVGPRIQLNLLWETYPFDLETMGGFLPRFNPDYDITVTALTATYRF